MGNPQAVYLVRHGIRINMEVPNWGETADRPDDPPLSANGLAQARETAAYLAANGRDIRHIYSSPFVRAVQTAGPIAEALSLRVCVEPGFSEWLNPQWQREQPRILSITELVREVPQVDPAYSAVGAAAYPELDERVEVFNRVDRTLKLLLGRSRGAIVVVAHGSPIVQAARALCGSAEGLDLHMCAVNRFVREEGGWRLDRATSAHLTMTEDQIRFN